MLQPATLCCNKVQAEFKEEIELYRDKEFSIATPLKKCVKKIVVTLLISIATLLKENGSGTSSRQSLLFRNIKE